MSNKPTLLHELLQMLGCQDEDQAACAHMQGPQSLLPAADQVDRYQLNCRTQACCKLQGMLRIRVLMCCASRTQQVSTP